MRTMPASYDCSAFGFKNDQEGLFYDASTNTLLRGKIIDFMLVAEVVHDGSDYDNGRFFAAFRVGYTYNDWDLVDITWFPEDILTSGGYQKWIVNPKVTVVQINAFIKAKRILIEILETK